MVPFLEVFDYSGTEGSIGSRAVTTVAPQALTLLNSDFVSRQAGRLAHELQTSQPAQDDTALINALFRRTLARDARPQEIDFGHDYLEKQTAKHEAVRHQLIFAPDVPASIEGGFLNSLPQEKFLIPPAAGWRAHSGKWGGGYEGIKNVVPGRGPFVLMTTVAQADFTVSGRMQFGQSVEHAGILLRATNKGAEDKGYEVYFDATNHELQLRRHDGDTRTLAKRELRNSFGWRDVRVELTGGTLRVWLDGAEAPFLAVTDEKPIEGKGYIGVRAWGGAVRTDELKLHLAKRTLLIDEINPAKSTTGKPIAQAQPGLAKRRALQDLCSVMFNISEFIYVD